MVQLVVGTLRPGVLHLPLPANLVEPNDLAGLLGRERRVRRLLSGLPQLLLGHVFRIHAHIGEDQHDLILLFSSFTRPT